MLISLIGQHRMQFISIVALSFALCVIVGLPGIGVGMMWSRETRTSWLSSGVEGGVYSVKNIGGMGRLLLVESEVEHFRTLAGTGENATNCLVGFGEKVNSSERVIADSFKCEGELPPNRIPDHFTAIVVTPTSSGVGAKETVELPEINEKELGTDIFQSTNLYILSIFIATIVVPCILALFTAFRLFSKRWRMLAVYFRLRGIRKRIAVIYGSAVNIAGLLIGTLLSIPLLVLIAYFVKSISWDGYQFNDADSIVGMLIGVLVTVLFIVLMIVSAVCDGWRNAS